MKISLCANEPDQKQTPRSTSATSKKFALRERFGLSRIAASFSGYLSNRAKKETISLSLRPEEHGAHTDSSAVPILPLGVVNWRFGRLAGTVNCCCWGLLMRSWKCLFAATSFFSCPIVHLLRTPREREAKRIGACISKRCQPYHRM